MTIKYRQIGAASYTTLSFSNNIIRDVHQFSGYDLKFEPTIPDNYLHVKIEKYPDNLNMGSGWNPETNIFKTDDSIKYVQDQDRYAHDNYVYDAETQFFTFFNLYGRYVISFKEYTSDDTLYSTHIMYFEVFDLKRDRITFPFAGEGYEFETSGWSAPLNKSIIALNSESSNDAKICKSSDTLAATDLCEIEFTSLDQNDIIYDVVEPVLATEKNAYGIVLDVYEDCYIWINDGVYNTTLYRVGFKGSFISDNLSFTTDLMLYFNNITKTISDDDSYTYIGKWIADQNLLIIENEIIGYNTNIDLDGTEGSLIVKGSSDWEELSVEDENQTLQIKEGIPAWSNPNMLFEKFKNNSGSSISQGACVQFGGIYDDNVRFVDENDISSYELSDGGIVITEDELVDDSATIKQYRKTGGVLGAKSSSLLTDIHSMNRVYKSGEESITVWDFYVVLDGATYNLNCRKFNPLNDPSLTDESEIVTGITAHSDDFAYDFHYIDNDCGLLVAYDNTTTQMGIYFISKGLAKTTILEQDMTAITGLSDLYSIETIKITKHDSLFNIYFSYTLLTSGDYYSGIKCFTVNNINWLDVSTSIIDIEDNIDILESTINFVPADDSNPRFNVCNNRDNTDVVVICTPIIEIPKIFIGSLTIRDLESGIIEFDPNTIMESGAEDYYFNYKEGLSIIKLKENLLIMTYISSTSNKYETYIVKCFNDSNDSFEFSDTSFISPIIDLIDGVNYTTAYSFQLQSLSEDQFALIYNLKKNDETYKFPRIALGTVLNNSSIFWQEQIDPVKWGETEDIISYSVCFSKPITTDGMLFISSRSAADMRYIDYYKYFAESENNVIGIAQELIAHEAVGSIGLGGIITIANGTLIPRANYYCDDEGVVTNIPTDNYIGQALNTSKLIFTPGKKYNGR